MEWTDGFKMVEIKFQGDPIMVFTRLLERA